MDGRCRFEATDQTDALENHPCCREDEKKADSPKGQTSDLRPLQETSPQRRSRSSCQNCRATLRKIAARRSHSRRKPAMKVGNSPGSAEVGSALFASAFGIQRRRACTIVSPWHSGLPAGLSAYRGLY